MKYLYSRDFPEKYLSKWLGIWKLIITDQRKKKGSKQESSSGSERMVTQYWSAEYKDDIKKKIILVAISVVEIKQLQRLVQSSNQNHQTLIGSQKNYVLNNFWKYNFFDVLSLFISYYIELSIYIHIYA